MKISGFDWNALPEGSIVVDVGGGLGNMTMALSQKYKHLKYVVQDRHAVIKAAHDVSCPRTRFTPKLTMLSSALGTEDAGIR